MKKRTPAIIFLIFTNTLLGSLEFEDVQHPRLRALELPFQELLENPQNSVLLRDFLKTSYFKNRELKKLQHTDLKFLDQLYKRLKDSSTALMRPHPPATHCEIRLRRGAVHTALKDTSVALHFYATNLKVLKSLRHHSARDRAQAQSLIVDTYYMIAQTYKAAHEYTLALVALEEASSLPFCKSNSRVANAIQSLKQKILTLLQKTTTARKNTPTLQAKKHKIDNATNQFAGLAIDGVE